MQKSLKTCLTVPGVGPITPLTQGAGAANAGPTVPWRFLSRLTDLLNLTLFEGRGVLLALGGLRRKSHRIFDIVEQERETQAVVSLRFAAERL